MFCTMVVCFALAGCQDVVRRVDDKYRPVKEPGSVTVLADRADDLGVPIQIKNLSVDELELKLTGEDKDTYQWLLFGYNECARLLNEKEQEFENQKK